MVITTRAVDIAVPPERLFAFITNPDHVKEWQPDLLEYKFLTEGGIRPGARIRAAMVQRGRGRIDAELTVVTATSPEHLVYHSEEVTSSSTSTTSCPGARVVRASWCRWTSD